MHWIIIRLTVQDHMTCIIYHFDLNLEEEFLVLFYTQIIDRLNPYG